MNETTKTLMRVSAKDRLLHMKKKDDQSTGLNSKQGITKRLFKRRRRNLEEKSEFRDNVKEVAAVKPVLTMLGITLQCPNSSHAGQSRQFEQGQFEQLFSGEWGGTAGCRTQGDTVGITPRVCKYR